MPEINIDIWCSCGEGLCNQTKVDRNSRGFIVEPCEKCLEKARDKGYNDGYDAGYQDAKKEFENETS
jgi:flagellar biosynthesis/type III secretory pathway protein FliH